MPAAAPGDDEFCIPAFSEDAFIEAFNDPAPRGDAPGIVPPPIAAAPAIPAAPVSCTSPHIVRIFQIFEPGRIAPSLLYVAPNRSGILHPAMDHLFLPVAPHPEGNSRRKRAGGNGHERHEQHEQQQNISSLGTAARRENTAIAELLRHKVLELHTSRVANDQGPTTSPIPA